MVIAFYYMILFLCEELIINEYLLPEKEHH